MDEIVINLFKDWEVIELVALWENLNPGYQLGLAILRKDGRKDFWSELRMATFISKKDAIAYQRDLRRSIRENAASRQVL